MSQKGLRKIYWTEKDEDILKQYYCDNGLQYCSKILNKTSKAIATKAEKLGLKRNRFINLTGKIFERWTVKKYEGRDKNRTSLWLCECVCGKRKIINSSSLKSGKSKSCGCLMIEKAIQRNKTHKDCWTEEEDNILKQFYCDKGSEFCSKLLFRKRNAIIQRSHYLNLKTKFNTKSGLLKKYIIKKLPDNMVISLCKVHGKVKHYYSDNKIMGCVECTRIRVAKRNSFPDIKKQNNQRRKKYLENPMHSFVARLRSLINFSFRRVCGSNYVPRGGFRNLNYTPTDLYNHLHNIQKSQNNKCPICQTDYNKCIVSIEHIVPVSKAKTEQQVIDLFALSNLSLMCKNCNSSKHTSDFKTWMESKRES